MNISPGDFDLVETYHAIDKIMQVMNFLSVLWLERSNQATTNPQLIANPKKKVKCQSWEDLVHSRGDVPSQACGQ